MNEALNAVGYICELVAADYEIILHILSRCIHPDLEWGMRRNWSIPIQKGVPLHYYLAVGYLGAYEVACACRDSVAFLIPRIVNEQVIH